MVDQTRDEAAPETKGLAEHDFLPLLWERVQPFIRLEALEDGFSHSGSISGKVCSQLAEEARSLESFLDDYGARENQTFITLTEMVAALRSFAIVGYTLALIRHRTQGVYPADPDGSGRFVDELVRVQGVIDRTIRGILKEIWSEGALLFENQEDSSPPPAAPEVESEDTTPRARLQRTVSDEGDANIQKRVSSLCSVFLALQKKLASAVQVPLEDLDSLRDHAMNVADEQQCRFFETRILNLISRYDNFIRGSKAETEDADLEAFRTLIGMMRRLGRVLTELVHYHERYEGEVSSQDVRERLSKVISETEVLDCALNFALYFVAVIAQPARKLAEELINRHTSQQQIVCQVPDDVHMHVRPVSLIAKIVQHHGTPVQVTIGESPCYAGSVVQFLMAVGAQPDIRELAFEGDAGALDDIKALFEAGLGERDGPLPRSLGYLGL